MDKTINIYIVEDYVLFRLSIVSGLKGCEGINVLNAFATAEECIEAMEACPADVILMDLGLPQMNGIEATKLIHESFSNTHIIELTSHESENEMLARIASGARGYVLKSTSNLQLADIIRAVSTGAFYFDPVLEQIPLAEIPKPNSTNFDNLYSFDNIKEKLSSRELEVFKLVAQGKTNPEIAEELIISLNTAKAHVGSILNKLQLSDRMQIAVLAYKANIVKWHKLKKNYHIKTRQKLLNTSMLRHFY